MIKKIIKNLITFVWPKEYKNGVLILNYHSIDPSGKYSTKPEDFDQQMKYLSENFKTLKLKDLDIFKDKLGVVITFDDGFFDNYQYAFPILKKYNLPATVFLVSDFVFNNIDITKEWLPYNGLKPLSVEQIKEMSASGLIDFGSHGKTHKKVSLLSNEDFKKELTESKKIIESCVGKSIESYAFPFGQKLDQGNFSLDFFKSFDFNYVCTTEWGINKDTTSKAFLKRIRIDGDDTLTDFKNKLNGSLGFITVFQYFKNLKC